MHFESNMSILYSDTQISDIFITEYMPSMHCDFIKIYIYCLFLSKFHKQSTAEDISKKLDIETARVRDGLSYLENAGVISRKDSHITIIDLKEKEIKKLYRPKTASTPEEAALSSERNKKRSSVIRDINNKFFQGVMSPIWYTDIDLWFDKYSFEEDVMFALFEQCYLHKGLNKQYIIKVADSWHSKGIRNGFDLDRYSLDYQRLKDIKLKIMKKLRKKDPLTEYQEAYVEKWVGEYGFDFEIIDLALKKTTATLNPNFEYLNKILTDWHEKGYKTKEEFLAMESARKQQAGGRKGQEPNVPQKANYEQRKNDDEYFSKLYKDV